MLFQVIGLIILILFNAYFAASEMAYISLNDNKIDKEAKEGNKKAKKIQKMLNNPSKFLATIQIGITLAGFLSSAFAADTFATQLAPVLNSWIPSLGIGFWETLSIIIITIILSFFTLIFGELVPKRLAMKNYEKIAFGSIGIIRGISIVTSPFVKLLTATTNAVSKLFGVGETDEELVTEEEIRMMVDQGEEKGTIKVEEKELINNVFELNNEYIIPASYLSRFPNFKYCFDDFPKLEYSVRRVKSIVVKTNKIKKFDTNISGVTIEHLINTMLNVKKIDSYNFLVENKICFFKWLKI